MLAVVFAVKNHVRKVIMTMVPLAEKMCILLLKKSYGRTAGKPMGCKKDEEKGGALCYPKCKPGYKGVGPVCWTE